MKTVDFNNLTDIDNELKNSKMDYRDYNFSKSRAKKIIEEKLDKYNNL